MPGELSLLEASEIVEDAEVKAWWDLCQAVPADLAERLGLSVQRHGDITVSTCLMFDDLLGNRAFGLSHPTPCSESTFSEIVAHFRSHGLRNYALQLSPLVQPEGLSAWLSEVGLERRSRWAKVLRDNRNPPEITSPYEICKIIPGGAEAFGNTVASGYGWPPIKAKWMAATVGHPGWHHYLAYASERPIASGALFVAGDVGWLGIGATLPGYRRRGAHGALMARRIRDAIQVGCRWLVCETGEANPSYRDMLRTGFRLVYLRDNYCEKASSSGALTQRISLWVRKVLR